VADGVVNVRLDKSELHTEAKLTLSALAGTRTGGNSSSRRRPRSSSRQPTRPER
jgi:hypothetical protein